MQATLEQLRNNHHDTMGMADNKEVLQAVIGRATPEVIEYADLLVRNLIDTIKAIGEDEIRIIFKSGFEMDQRL